MARVDLQLNSYSLQDASTDSSGTGVVTNAIRHDGSPDQDLNTLRISRRDGEKLISASYQPKVIVISGRIKGADQETLEQNIDEFNRQTAVTSGNLDISYAGGYRRYTVAVQSVAITRASYHVSFVPFQITFRVSDPPFAQKVNALGGDLAVEEALSQQGIAVAAWDSTITIDGSARPKPTMTLTLDTVGNLDEIRVRNARTNQQIGVGTSWSNGDNIVIDTDDMTVKRTGVDVDFLGNFPEFETGPNQLQLALIQSNVLNQTQTQSSLDAEVNGNYLEEAQTFTPDASTNYSKIELLLKKELSSSTDTQSENFLTTTKKDAGNTTANWDTTNGIAVLNLGSATLDVSSGGSDPNNYSIGTVAEGNRNIVTSFVPTTSGVLATIRTYAAKVGSPTDSLVCNIYADQAGLPGILLATATNSFAASSLSSDLFSLSTCDFTFSEGLDALNLVAGTTYWVNVQCTRTALQLSNSNYMVLRKNPVSGSYSGQTYSDPTPGSGWVLQSGDLGFAQYYKAYNTSNNVIQSTGFDTGNTTNTFYATGTIVSSTPTGTSITYEYADSADNSSWSSFTTDITSLTRRYIKFKITLNGTTAASPYVDTISMDYLGKLLATLWNTSAGSPSTSIEQIYLSLADLGTTYALIAANFTSVALTASTVYAVSVVPTNANRKIYWGYVGTNPYSGGQRLRRTSAVGSWTAFSTDDHAFNVYKTSSPNWSVDFKVEYVPRYL